MPSPLAVNDVLQITYFCTLDAQTIETVIHWRVEVVPSGGSTAEAQLADLVEWLRSPISNSFLEKYKAAAASNFFFDYVNVQRVYPTRNIYIRGQIDDFGSQANAAITANLACSIEKQTLTVGRKGVGRMQFAGLPTDGVAGGYIDPDYKAAYMTPLANKLFGGLTAGITYTGTYRNCLPAAAGGGSAYDVFNAFPMDTVRTMHRRTVGLGI